jgi:phosphotransferase system enzyme I (PtsI)
LLIGMGLRSFSMHPTQLFSVKQAVLGADTALLTAKVTRLLRYEEPDRIREQLARLNAAAH